MGEWFEQMLFWEHCPLASVQRGLVEDHVRACLHSAIVDATATLELAFVASADCSWLALPRDHEEIGSRLRACRIDFSGGHTEPRDGVGFAYELLVSGRRFVGVDPELERSRKRAELEFV